MLCDRVHTRDRYPLTDHKTTAENALTEDDEIVYH